ncbi:MULTISPECIES: EAL-associated domain-containing protein [Exiguobacterium]|uniref:EAL-associated domain-containing protein n=1 Tax=Exiguobacterium TaxID=33986 RepID=UPI000649ABF4|nr:MULTISPECIES: EAL-associated domain-containing protein [Exiguobacterium]MDX5981463.1 EAL-associated domain-containing protein [Exiguobacterium profundum]QUP86592.1 EAL domain-containing protein [Exiguobacterium sp. PFWT01]
MDAVEVMVHPEEVMVTYEPILGAATFQVEGYMVHGRFRGESLTPFFYDDDVPLEYQLDIAQRMEQLAAAQLRDAKPFVTFRCRSEWILEEGGEAFLAPLRELNFPLHRIYVTLQGTDLVDVPRLSRVIQYYRSYGLKIALDFAESTSIEDIMTLAPELLLVDLGTMIEKKTLSVTYPNMLQTMEYIASKLGAPLLYKSIDHIGQLRYAWQHGGRYYMGGLLGSEDEIPQREIKGMGVLAQEVPSFFLHDQKRLNRLYELEFELHRRIGELVQSGKWSRDKKDEWIQFIAPKLEEVFVRYYITDKTGFQTSANVYCVNGEWRVDNTYRGYNWSFRPYFIQTMAAMDVRGRGYLSGDYRDFSSNEVTRTFSYPLPDGMFLFADISEEYLYQNRLLD